jgi:hypothetical protein
MRNNVKGRNIFQHCELVEACSLSVSQCVDIEKRSLSSKEGMMFGPSHSHRIWRMMNALIDARPEWADKDTFEADREKMLRHGTSIGLNVGDMVRVTDPDVILSLWTAAEAAQAQD